MSSEDDLSAQLLSPVTTSMAPQAQQSRRRALHVACACISGFLLGYDLCVIGSVLTPVQRALELCFPCAGGASDAVLAHCTCQEKQFAVSSVTLGAVVGGVMGGSAADRLGRRAALALTDVGFIIGAACMALAGPGPLASAFFGGRALTGLALGAAGAVSSAYIAEIAPPRQRGMLLTLNELSVCMGCLAASASALLFGDERWRWTIGVAGAPALAQLLSLTALMEESPRWLSEAGKPAAAAKAAARLGLDDTLLSPPSAGGDDAPLLPKLRAHRRPLALAAGCALAHAATGANVVLYYSRDILQAARLGDPLVANVGVGVVKLLGVLACVLTVDRVGRRSLLLVGSALMSLSLAGLAAAFGEGENGGVALGSLLLFVLGWDISWAGLMLAVAAELLPQPVRGLGLGLAYSLYWVLSFAESQTLESLFAALGHSSTFGAYAATSLLALLFSWRFVPETRGASLDGVARASTSSTSSAPGAV